MDRFLNIYNEVRLVVVLNIVQLLLAASVFDYLKHATPTMRHQDFGDSFGRVSD